MADDHGQEVTDRGGVHMNEFDIPPRASGGSQPTLRSVSVAKRFDWVGLGIILVIGILVQFLAPTFQTYVNQAMLAGLNFPIRSDTVPTALLPVIALVVPLCICLLVFCWQRDWKDLHNASLGLFLTVACTWLVTNALKLSIGRPRPDFSALCFQGAIRTFGSDGNVACSTLPSEMHSARQSFPSGHTSLSFSGMVYLSLYVAGKVRLGDRKGHLSKLLLLLLPLGAATMVGVSRMSDYKHQWQDVVAGALIGIGFAAFFFTHYLPQTSNAALEDPTFSFHPLENVVEPPVELAVSRESNAYPSTTLFRNPNPEFHTEVHPHGRFDNQTLPRDSSASKHEGLKSFEDPHLPGDRDNLSLDESKRLPTPYANTSVEDGRSNSVSTMSYRTPPPAFGGSRLSQRSGGNFGSVSEIVAQDS